MNKDRESGLIFRFACLLWQLREATLFALSSLSEQLLEAEVHVIYQF